MSMPDATQDQPEQGTAPGAPPPPTLAGPPDHHPAYRPPAHGPIIVHEDLCTLPDGTRGGFVVVDKPAGLLSVPGLGEGAQDCVRSRILARYPWATGPMTVHRLDRLTSGALIVALDPFTQRHFSIEFERRRVRKTYVALLGGPGVAGRLAVGARGCITTPMRKDLSHPVRQIIDFEQGRPAETHYEVMAAERHPDAPDGYVRVRFEPRTGRTHQLRLHAADPLWPAIGAAPSDLMRGLGAPIVGDDLYTPCPRAGPPAGSDAGADAGPPARLFLHARTIEFAHPVTRRLMGVLVPEPF